MGDALFVRERILFDHCQSRFREREGEIEDRERREPGWEASYIVTTYSINEPPLIHWK